MKSGIYKITCGRYFYIGSTKDFDKRWASHKKKLRNGTHSNQFMQNLYNKTRGHGFKFEVLIGCAESMLRQMEQELIDEHFDDKNCLNLNPFADRPASWGRNKPKKVRVVFADGTEKTFISSVEAAAAIGCTKATVYAWIKKDRKPSKKWAVKEIGYAAI